MRSIDIAKLLLPGATCYRVLLVLKSSGLRTTDEISRFLGVSRQQVHNAFRELEKRKICTDLIRQVKKKNKKKSARNLKKKEEIDFFSLIGEKPVTLKRRKKPPGKIQRWTRDILLAWGPIHRFTQKEIDERKNDWAKLYQVLHAESLENIKAVIARYVVVLENPDRFTVSTKLDILEFFLGTSLLSYSKMKRWDELAHEYYCPLDEDSLAELRDAVLSALNNESQLKRWAERFGPIVWRMKDELT